MPAQVRRRVTCPCGRRVSNIVVAEGQATQPLACTPDCERQARRARLAEAFGVSADHYVPVQERTRQVSYPPDLLLSAKHIPGIVAELERSFAAFLRDPDAKRMSLPAMLRSQRAVAHALAEQYGFASNSVRAEPNRCVEVFKTPKSALPSRFDHVHAHLFTWRPVLQH